MTPNGPTDLTKRSWRAYIAAERAGVSAAVRVDEAHRLAAIVARWRLFTICAYVPTGHEPGTGVLLEVLQASAKQVLLPVVPPARGPLDWARYDDEVGLKPGRIPTVLEPTGPRLGPEAIASAELVLVPAMAVDLYGTRLGRGGGYYDRSLVLAGAAQRIAVIRDTELVAKLPAEPHDVPLTGAVTPSCGLIALPAH